MCPIYNDHRTICMDNASIECALCSTPRFDLENRSVAQTSCGPDMRTTPQNQNLNGIVH